MGTNVQNNVETHFSITGNAMAAAGQLGGAMSALGGIVSRVTSTINPLNMALGALSGALSMKAITDLGSKFEQTQIVMGGFLNSLGVSSSYAQGFELASSVMDKIRIDAAALPGEASEYIEVFKSGLPIVQKAIGGTLQDMVNFTNRYTAIAKTLQVDVGQASRDMAMMLREGKGGAGLDVRTFTQLLPFMKQVEGQANLTQEAFNKMTQPERAKLLNDTFAKLQPMLDKSASSFDAMWGALKSNTENVLRIATTPLFEASKKGLERFNALLYNADGSATRLASQITEIGQMVAYGLVDGLEMGVKVGRQLWDVFQKFRDSNTFKALETTFNKGLDIVGKIGSGVGALSGVLSKEDSQESGPMAELVGAAVVLTAAFTGLGPAALAIAAVFTGFMSHGEAVKSTLTGLNNTVQLLMGYLSPLIDTFMSVSAILGDFAAAVLPPLIGAFNQILGALLPLWESLNNTYQTVAAQLRPVLQQLWEKIGGLVTAIGNVLGPILKWLGEIIAWVANAMAESLVPVIKKVVQALSWLVDAITAAVQWIASKVGKGGEGLKGGLAAAVLGEASAAPGVGAAPAAPNTTAPNALASTPAGGAKAPGGGASGGGGRAVNDFRFSRFEITQKFAEGFDPDRIAVAFAQDIGRMGDLRLQSGFEPLFSVR